MMIILNHKKGKKKMKKVLLILSLLLITSCIPESMVSPYNFKWVSPLEGSLLKNPDLQLNQTEIKLTYDLIPPDPDINFNSQNVAECFEFFPNEAIADLNCFKSFFKEGENTLQVMNERFGPKLNFNIEFKGPTFAIRQVCYENSTHCSVEVEENNVNIEVEYRDFSGISMVTLNGIEPYLSINEKRKRFLINVSDTYIFESEDNEGNKSKAVYKADGQEIEEIINVRIDENFIQNIKEILENGISGFEIPENDPQLEGLQNLTVDFPLLCNVSVKQLKFGKLKINNIGIDDSNKITTKIEILPTDESLFNIDSDKGDGDVENINNVGVEALLDVSLGGPIACFFGGFTSLTAKTYVEVLEINSDVDLSIENNEFNIKLNNSDEAALILRDVEVTDGDIGGLLDVIIESPLFRGIILTLVQSALDNNLNEIKIENEFETKDGKITKISLQPTDVEVYGNADTDSVGDIVLNLKGEVETLVRNEKVFPALGSFYVDDTNLPPVPDNGSSLGVTLNSNIVNEVLLSAYNVGVTHISLLNGEVYFGPDETDDLGSEGDIRYELYPSSPGQFFAEKNVFDKGFLEYNGAELKISGKNNGIWKEIFLVDVDIRAGVLVIVRESKVYITIAEDPFFDIRKITDLNIKREIKLPYGSLFVDFTLNKNNIKNSVEETLKFLIPFVAESELEIDISKLNLPRKLSTESISTEGGHLRFDIGVE